MVNSGSGHHVGQSPVKKILKNNIHMIKKPIQIKNMSETKYNSHSLRLETKPLFSRKEKIFVKKLGEFNLY